MSKLNTALLQSSGVFVVCHKVPRSHCPRPLPLPFPIAAALYWLVYSWLVCSSSVYSALSAITSLAVGKQRRDAVQWHLVASADTTPRPRRSLTATRVFVLCTCSRPPRRTSPTFPRSRGRRGCWRRSTRSTRSCRRRRIKGDGGAATGAKKQTRCVRLISLASDATE